MSGEVVDVFEAHSGCAAVAALVRLDGITHDMVMSWRKQGITANVHHGVDRLAGAPQTDEQRLWAALLRCGDSARAGPAATLWLFGLEGFAQLAVDVVVEAPRRCRATDFPVLTRCVDPVDRTSMRGFPALAPARAIVEIAHTLTDKQLRVLIDSARRKRLVTIERLRDRAAELRDTPGSRRGARAVLRLIGDGSTAQESENEREIAVFLATTTLELEWQVTDVVPGRRLDAVDRAARIILEIDSRLWHSLGSDRDHDGLRDLEIADETGEEEYLVFHLTLGMVRFEGERTRQHLDAIRARRKR